MQSIAVSMKRTMSAMVDINLAAKLQVLALTHGRTVSKEIEQAIREHVEREVK